jgi:hypothetical protein
MQVTYQSLWYRTSRSESKVNLIKLSRSTALSVLISLWIWSLSPWSRNPPRKWLSGRCSSYRIEMVITWSSLKKGRVIPFKIEIATVRDKLSNLSEGFQKWPCPDSPSLWRVAANRCLSSGNGFPWTVKEMNSWFRTVTGSKAFVQNLGYGWFISSVYLW